MLTPIIERTFNAITRREVVRQQTTEVAKQIWVDEYAERILRYWQNWPGPLGIDKQYMGALRIQLEEFFDEPLKRELIENSYYRILNEMDTNKNFGCICISQK